MKFKIGEKVYAPKFFKEEELTISCHYSTIVSDMYGFEGKGDISIGEMYLKKSLSEKDARYSGPLREKASTSFFNSMLTSSYGAHPDKELFKTVGVEFFSPNYKMVNWLANYAGDRIVIEIGSGIGGLLKSLSGKVRGLIGVEPNYDMEAHYKRTMIRGEVGFHVLPYEVQSSIVSKMIRDLGDKVLLIIARPCHSNFVEDTLDICIEGQELLYITKPENFELYDDLGKYKNQAVVLKHEGSSVDNEVVFSIKK